MVRSAVRGHLLAYLLTIAGALPAVIAGEWSITFMVVFVRRVSAYLEGLITDRRLPEVEACMAALSALAAPATLVEAVRSITGRDVSGWMSRDYYASLKVVGSTLHVAALRNPTPAT